MRAAFLSLFAGTHADAGMPYIIARGKEESKPIFYIYDIKG